MTTLLLATLLLAPPAVGQPIQAEVQDPVGDSDFSPTDAPAPDFRSVTVGMSPAGDVVLVASFAPQTFVASVTYVQFNLQVARATSAVDPCAQCGNYLVDYNMIGAPSQKAQVQRLGSNGQYEVAGSAAVTTSANRLRLVVPARLLPKDISRLTFRVVAGVKLEGNAVSIILDRAPDSGAPAGILEVATGGRTRS